MFKSFLAALFAIFFISSGFAQYNEAGAWQLKNGDTVHTVVLTDGYLSHSVFDINNKKFYFTRGGTYQINNNKLDVTWQYDTEKTAAKISPEQWLGKVTSFDIDMVNGQVYSNISGRNQQWTQTDDNNAPLAGVWRFYARKQNSNDAIKPSTLGDRRTLKILTGNRFQWAAINIKTGEFFGTGGGTYTFSNGKYTENIEFFSRNNDRVGASLTFDGKIEDGKWHHFGNSSSGEPIYEVWSRIKED